MFGLVSLSDFLWYAPLQTAANYPLQQGKSAKDVITIFHKPSLRASTRVMNFLKQTHATAAETSTIDQASDHSKHSAVQRAEFDLEVVEQDPTPDQISTILSYVGHKRISEFVNGASSESDAIKKIKESADAFNRPVVCCSSAMLAKLFSNNIGHSGC